jgi:subtilisin family serine protease
MQALEYVMRKAEELGQPVAVNLSFGNVYGSHRGNSLLETYINQLSDRGRNVIAIGTGNEGNAAGHASGQVPVDGRTEIQFVIDDYETSLNIQLWKDYADEYGITMIAPDGRAIGPFSRELGTARYQLARETLLVYYGEPSPYQSGQEIYIDFIPNGTYLDSGIWTIVLTGQQIVTGRYDFWMNDARARGSGTKFLSPSPEVTMTIPSTASRVIAVGAYDARLNAYASFSGRGWSDETYQIRPDLVAPGVQITTTSSGGGYTSVTGTSFATPFVTGSAALMMQWGIVQGNDPYLYGEKVKASLRRGARHLPGFTAWPNNQVGYGEDVIIRSHSRKPVKSSVSTRFPRTEKEHFNRYFEENLPGLDSKCWCGCDL